MDYFYPFIASSLGSLWLAIKWWQARRELARLERELMVDFLAPPLLNKRGFFERGVRVLDRERHPEQVGGRVGIAYFDLDGFKPVNDRLGHEAGDEVLRLFARLMSEHFRPSDILARMGGDEFAGIFPRMEEDVLHRKCSALVAELERRTHEKYGIKVSATFCALSFASKTLEGATLEGLLHEADRGMLLRKTKSSR